MDSADDDIQRTPGKTDAMDIDDPGSAGRYPRRKRYPVSNIGYPPHIPSALAQTQTMELQSAILNQTGPLLFPTFPIMQPYGTWSDYAQGHLRQDPRPTQMYQPDLGVRRNYQTTASPQASPAPRQEYHNASADPRNPAFSLDKYEPRQPHALTLKQIITPGNNPDMFRQRKAIEKAQAMPRTTLEPQHFLKPVIPNSMNAPNIYIRCLYGLRSGVIEEQEFALHHLVKVSFERGDKYKFEGFPLLAESLLEKILEVTRLIYGIDFDITYEGEASTTKWNTLDASHGTPGMLDRIEMLEVKIGADEFETAEFSRSMEKLNEAALVMRNMIILEENAAFIARFPLFRDFLVIALNLPSQPRLAEFQHYALEMTEQATRYWSMKSEDALYISLLGKLSSYDRGTILPALQAIIRIGIDTATTQELRDVPVPVIERLVGLLLLDQDDPLTLACLDFVYQFTASPDNVKATLVSSPDLFSRLTPRLVSLILHNATLSEEKLLVKQPQKPPPSINSIPLLPTDLFMTLVHLPEPERSSRWLRCCFEESRDDEITQIAIWQAYQARFSQSNPIPAADFIKNVSSTFNNAHAQVINGPTPRFIIKGIRARRVLVGPGGEVYFKCMWETSPTLEQYGQYQKPGPKPLCSSWHSTRKDLWTHMCTAHFGIHVSEDGQLTNASTGSYSCCWQGCLRHQLFSKASDAGMHIRQHIPQSAEAAAKADLPVSKEAEFAKHSWYNTPLDEKGHPCGIPYMSVLVLRNLARFAMRNPNALVPAKGQHGSPGAADKNNLTHKFFGHVKGELWSVVSVSKTLIYFLGDLVKMIEAGEEGKKTT